MVGKIQLTISNFLWFQLNLNVEVATYSTFI